MKKIFKFMGIALMASSLMVACGGSDEPENPDTPGTPDNPETVTAKATVTFNGAEWEATANQLTDNYYAQYGIMYERLYKVQGYLPYVDIMGTATPGNYSYTAEIATADSTDDFPNGYTYVAQNTNMDLYMIEYGEKEVIQTQQGNFADWSMLNATMTISSFDANSLVASFNVTAEMYDFYSWYYGQVVNVEDAATANLTVDVKNYTFTK